MKPKEGETVNEYIKRYLTEIHKKTPIREPIITHLIYKFNNIESKEDYENFVKITNCDFNTYKDLHKEDRIVSFEFETIASHPLDPLHPDPITYTWNDVGFVKAKPSYECTGVVAHKYRKKTYAPKLKRLMR